MIDSETGEYRYEEVARAEGVSSSEIQSRAKSWLTEYYTQIDSMKTDSSSVKQLNTFRFRWTLIRKAIDVELFFVIDEKNNHVFAAVGSVDGVTGADGRQIAVPLIRDGDTVGIGPTDAGRHS